MRISCVSVEFKEPFPNVKSVMPVICKNEWMCNTNKLDIFKYKCYVKKYTRVVIMRANDMNSTIVDFRTFR